MLSTKTMADEIAHLLNVADTDSSALADAISDYFSSTCTDDQDFEETEAHQPGLLSNYRDTSLLPS